MTDHYFTATKDKRSARIVVPSIVRAGQLKSMLENKGVHCGGVFDVGPGFERSAKEQEDAFEFLDLIL